MQMSSVSSTSTLKGLSIASARLSRVRTVCSHTKMIPEKVIRPLIMVNGKSVRSPTLHTLPAFEVGTLDHNDICTQCGLKVYI